MEMLEKQSLDLSVIMPCLNEAHTVGISVSEARAFMEKNHIHGEVLVVDNGSGDASAAVAAKHGARVVTQPRRGYGSAIRAGIASSRGKVIIIGDCDTTYDFLHLEAMYRLLAENECDMVIGNRFAGGMERGSMPWTHKWGVRFLSFFGRLRLHTDVCDFHCGLRGMRRGAAERLTFHTEGMEFATEMIAQAVKQELRIMQIPVVLRRCHHQRRSKLRTVRDGLRHFIYMIQIPTRRSVSWKEK